MKKRTVSIYRTDRQTIVKSTSETVTKPRIFQIVSLQRLFSSSSYNSRASNCTLRRAAIFTGRALFSISRRAALSTTIYISRKSLCKFAVRLLSLIVCANPKAAFTFFFSLSLLGPFTAESQFSLVSQKILNINQPSGGVIKMLIIEDIALCNVRLHGGVSYTYLH